MGLFKSKLRQIFGRNKKDSKKRHVQQHQSTNCDTKNKCDNQCKLESIYGYPVGYEIEIRFNLR
jgi:hypothetical protein